MSRVFTKDSWLPEPGRYESWPPSRQAPPRRRSRSASPPRSPRSSWADRRPIRRSRSRSPARPSRSPIHRNASTSHNGGYENALSQLRSEGKQQAVSHNMSHIHPSRRLHFTDGKGANRQAPVGKQPIPSFLPQKPVVINTPTPHRPQMGYKSAPENNRYSASGGMAPPANTIRPPTSGSLLRTAGSLQLRIAQPPPMKSMPNTGSTAAQTSEQHHLRRSSSTVKGSFGQSAPAIVTTNSIDSQKKDTTGGRKHIKPQQHERSSGVSSSRDSETPLAQRRSSGLGRVVDGGTGSGCKGAPLLLCSSDEEGDDEEQDAEDGEHSEGEESDGEESESEKSDEESNDQDSLAKLLAPRVGSGRHVPTTLNKDNDVMEIDDDPKPPTDKKNQKPPRATKHATKGGSTQPPLIDAPKRRKMSSRVRFCVPCQWIGEKKCTGRIPGKRDCSQCVQNKRERLALPWKGQIDPSDWKCVVDQNFVRPPVGEMPVIYRKNAPRQKKMQGSGGDADGDATMQGIDRAVQPTPARKAIQAPPSAPKEEKRQSIKSTSITKPPASRNASSSILKGGRTAPTRVGEREQKRKAPSVPITNKEKDDDKVSPSITTVAELKSAIQTRLTYEKQSADNLRKNLKSATLQKYMDREKEIKRRYSGVAMSSKVAENLKDCLGEMVLLG